MSEKLMSNLEWFYHWEKVQPNKVFLRQPYGKEWKSLTYAQAGQEARKMTTALKALGLKSGDHVALLSKNCYHWILADLAIMMGGYVSIPFYASLPKDKIAEVMDLSDAKAIFLGKLDSWGDKGEAFRDGIIKIKFPHYPNAAEITTGHEWNDLIEQHSPQTENFIPNLDDLWTIMFTSGTTGTPKGVMHKFSSPQKIMDNELKTNWVKFFETKEHKMFSFLPLNHVAERLGVEIPCIRVGGTISFAESIETFAKNLQDTQPTFIFAVPRIWTKFYLGVLAKMPQKKLDRLFKIPIVSGIVKKKLKTALGLRDIKIAATGAAITPKYIKDWYTKLGIHLVEAYGMTEVCGSITNSPDPNTPSDSVGKAVPGCEVKIHPETEEILMKTPWIMSGYYKDPEKTAEVLKDGWMHSGDRGRVDEQGFLKVIGRVKDAFKTAKGEFITPNPIEEKLSKNDFIEQVCVAGLTSPQPVALVNLSELAHELEQTHIEESLKEELKSLNSSLASYSKISTIIINKTPWSENNGLLTPTLKVRRGGIDDMFSENYMQWHEDKRKIIWWD